MWKGLGRKPDELLCRGDVVSVHWISITSILMTGYSHTARRIWGTPAAHFYYTFFSLLILFDTFTDLKTFAQFFFWRVVKSYFAHRPAPLRAGNAPEMSRDMRSRVAGLCRGDAVLLAPTTPINDALAAPQAPSGSGWFADPCHCQC